jgi:hypothetical protein
VRRQKPVIDQAVKPAIWQQQDSQDLRIESVIQGSSAERGLGNLFSGIRAEPKGRFAMIRPGFANDRHAKQPASRLDVLSWQLHPALAQFGGLEH